MLARAHTLIMRAAATGRPIATFDADAEFYLIQHGYAAYSTKPLMVLTQKAEDYAAKEIAWQRQEKRRAR
ncbi:hypothetical protein [Neorhizobium sp. LjRoot104]|uniref:hypothetical protein n=1 Tax=Neorhizobium sp. LjRoot104 TaxID=3342254 RepID=UPI003ECE6514